MITKNPLYTELELLKEFVYDRCGFSLTNYKVNSESAEYCACSFEIDGHKVEHRVSKITPKKTGQFVSILKRNTNGSTTPFDIFDDIDFIVITSTSDNNIGQFIFPKSVLADKGIISQKGKEGKRGIRIYPPWDTVTNKQAENTQNWQTKYFITFENDDFNNLELIRNLFKR